MRLEKCPYCGGSEIVENITVFTSHLNVGVRNIGLCFKAAMILNVVEPLLADLCKGCGSVARFHVQNTDRKWVDTAISNS